MKAAMETWTNSANASLAGKDFPTGKLAPGEPQPRFWTEVEAYRPYFEAWSKRPEYQSRLRPQMKTRSKNK